MINGALENMEKQQDEATKLALKQLDAMKAVVTKNSDSIEGVGLVHDTMTIHFKRGVSNATRDEIARQIQESFNIV